MGFKTVITGAGLAAILLSNTSNCPPNPIDMNPLKYHYSIENQISGPVSAGELSGVEIKGLAADYFGFKGVMPDSVDIDFKANLEMMWKEKLRIAKKNDDVKKFYDDYITNYDPENSKKMTLDDYINESADSINMIKNVIDWDSVMALKNDYWKKNNEKKTLDSAGAALVKEMALSLNQYTVIPNFFTEILSGANGYHNSLKMDFLLKHAGREFIDYIPAKDKWDSKGPSQFTINAWYDDGIKIVKASLINYALPEEHKIPKSMYGLSGMDHVKGTYLLNINNLCELVGSLNKKQFKFLKENWSNEQIAEFAALAHRHDPNAVNAGLKWINNKMKKDVHNYFTVKNKNHYVDYGKRFLSNFKGLRDYHYLKSVDF